MGRFVQRLFFFCVNGELGGGRINGELGKLEGGKMVELITKHSERYSLVLFWDKGVVRLKYRTTSSVPFCDRRGCFNSCKECLFYASFGCSIYYQEINEKSLDKLAQRLFVNKEELLRQIKSAEEFIYDFTAHQYTPCLKDGRCVVCYPCGHTECPTPARDRRKEKWLWEWRSN